MRIGDKAPVNYGREEYEINSQQEQLKVGNSGDSFQVRAGSVQEARAAPVEHADEHSYSLLPRGLPWGLHHQRRLWRDEEHVHRHRQSRFLKS